MPPPSPSSRAARSPARQFGISANSAALPRIYDDDHKENSTNAGNVKAPAERSNQNLKAPPKKPWVTHFAKPASTPSPSKRILGERNKSCSPVRTGTPRAVTAEGKLSSSPAFAELEDTAVVGPVKGVAELSKRIQQFLEDQEALLGIKTASPYDCKEGTPRSSSAVSGAESYDPYNSPFFERPKFLRLHENASSSPMQAFDMLQEARNAEELPLFEGDQIVVTPLQPIERSTSLSPVSTEESEQGALPAGDKKEDVETESDHQPSKEERGKEEVSAVVEKGEECNVAAVARGVLLKEAGHQRMEGDRNGTPIQEFEPEKEKGTAKDYKAQNTAEVVVPVNTTDNEQKVTEKGDKAQHTAEVVVPVNTTDNQPQNKEVDVGKVTDSSCCQVSEQGVISNEGAASLILCDPQLGVDICSGDEEVCDLGDVDLEGAPLRSRIAKKIFSTAILAAFVFLSLLASNSPELLPSFLMNNPVSALWQGSQYHEPASIFLRSMDGLWSSQPVYFLPADIRAVMVNTEELFKSVRKMSGSMSLDLQVELQVLSSNIVDWYNYVFHKLLSEVGGPNRHEDRARQFEWTRDYDFVEEALLDEEAMLAATTDWELLHEYDLQAANEFMQRSIPESLWSDLRRNFSRLSDSQDVGILLEDLMKLKGGNTEEDRLEVLQYFWEYAWFSSRGKGALVDVLHVQDGFNDGVPSLAEADRTVHGSDALLTVVSAGQPEKTQVEEIIGMDDEPESYQYQAFEVVTAEHEQPELLLTVVSADQAEKTQVEEIIGKDDEPESYQAFEVITAKHEQPELLDLLEKKGGAKEGEDDTQIGISAVEKSTDPVEHADAVAIEEAVQIMGVVGNEGGKVARLDHDDGISEVITEDHHGQDSTAAGKRFSEITTAAIIAATVVGVAGSLLLFTSRFRITQPHSINAAAPKDFATAPSPVQFLPRTCPPPQSVESGLDHLTDRGTPKQLDVTMIEKLNERFSSVLQSPAPELPDLLPRARKDEDLIRSPLPADHSRPLSPYGSFTTYKVVSKKEGLGVESKVTPVRRSSRLRNQTSTMSPSDVKRVAISPP